MKVFKNFVHYRNLNSMIQIFSCYSSNMFWRHIKLVPRQPCIRTNSQKIYLLSEFCVFQVKRELFSRIVHEQRLNTQALACMILPQVLVNVPLLVESFAKFLELHLENQIKAANASLFCEFIRGLIPPCS